MHHPSSAAAVVAITVFTLAPALANAQLNAQDGTPLAELLTEIETVAALSGEPLIVSAAGLTRDEIPLITIENPSTFDLPGFERRLVIVAGLDGNPESARIALDAVRWFKTAAPDQTRARWAVSVLPLANPIASNPPDTFPPTDGFFNDPDRPDSRYVWRWVTYQAPDLVVEVRVGPELQIKRSTDASGRQSDDLARGSLLNALADPMNGSGIGPVETMLVTAAATDGANVLREVLARTTDRRSPLRATIAKRLARDPITIARVLAHRYPETPRMSYIPGVAWVNTLRMAALTNDQTLRTKVLRDVRLWLDGEEPTFGDFPGCPTIAGTIVFSEIARSNTLMKEVAAKLAAHGLSVAGEERVPGVPSHGSGWSDDMFLCTVAAAHAADPDGLSANVRLLLRYADRLQQPNGLFHHASDARTAWGRGNGFAAMGLAETLTALPQDDPDRPVLLDVYRRHMRGLRANQAPDGMLRQVVDLPGSYREASVTALTLTAMARGIRFGWLDDSYVPVVQRAWRALLAHVANDGTLVDVCISTGAGPTLRHYLDRTAVNGADDRGAALALGAALEMHILSESL